MGRTASPQVCVGQKHDLSRFLKQHADIRYAARDPGTLGTLLSVNQPLHAKGVGLCVIPT